MRWFRLAAIGPQLPELASESSSPVHRRTLLHAASRGDQRAFARLLTLLEEGDEGARAAVAEQAPRGRGSCIVGITGAPGAGKSSLTDRLIASLRSAGDRVAVLAIDPSSTKTGGALLGDRIRMGAHATDLGVFIRSIGSRGQLGGLSAVIPDALRLVAASAVPWTIIETVGVGQAEFEVAGVADTTVLVLYPGWGDGVQANKAGVLEVADILVVNKADLPGADAAVRDLTMMLELSSPNTWTPPIIETTATTGDGVDRLREAIGAHCEYLAATGALEQRRACRFRAEVRNRMRDRVAAVADAWCKTAAFDALVRDGGDPHRLADIAARNLLTALQDERDS